MKRLLTSVQPMRPLPWLVIGLASLFRLVTPEIGNGQGLPPGASHAARQTELGAITVKAPHSAPMALIPAGEFAMGSDRGQDDEQPVHRVSVKAFYLDTQEVTVARYAEFLVSQRPDLPFKWNEATSGSHENKPVVGVNWYDARDYCRWVGRRLPTEAEWELAARGTEGRTYPWGDAHPTRSHANAGQTTWRGYDTVTNVGRFELGKTPDGVYDLAGNLWEWVADWYDPTYYQFSPRENPSGPRSGPLRGLRGGAWNNDAQAIRSANRAGYAPDSRRNDVGFRCAKDAPSSNGR